MRRRARSLSRQRRGNLRGATLRVFAENPGAVLDTHEVVRRVFGGKEVTGPDVLAVRWALRAHLKRGLLADMTRRWPDGRRRWALSANDG